MTPKQKAIELVEKIKPFVEYNELWPAKQCALIAVNEIINNDDPFKYSKTDEDDNEPYNGTLMTLGNYWVHVKEEIQKL